MFHLSFVDPPFNQGKDYRFFDDNQTDAQYWGMDARDIKINSSGNNARWGDLFYAA